jgi:hypothetical protein
MRVTVHGFKGSGVQGFRVAILFPDSIPWARSYEGGSGFIISHIEIDGPENAIFVKSVPLSSGIWKTLGTLIPSLSLIPLAAGNVEPGTCEPLQ